MKARVPIVLCIIALVAWLGLEFALIDYPRQKFSHRRESPTPKNHTLNKVSAGALASESNVPQDTPSKATMDIAYATVDDLVLASRAEFRRDPSTFFKRLSNQGLPANQHQVAEILLVADWAKTDPLLALAAVRNISFHHPQNSEASPTRVVLNQWAKDHPERVADWLIQHDWYQSTPKDYVKTLEAAFLSWGQKEPEKAVLWIANNLNALGARRGVAVEALALSLAVYGKDFENSEHVAILHPEPKDRARLLQEIRSMRPRPSLSGPPHT